MSVSDSTVIAKFNVKGIVAFSVFHTGAVDNFYYERSRGKNHLQKYSDELCNGGKFFLDEKEAVWYAWQKDAEWKTQYGLHALNLTDIHPPALLDDWVLAETQG